MATRVKEKGRTEAPGRGRARAVLGACIVMAALAIPAVVYRVETRPVGFERVQSETQVEVARRVAGRDRRLDRGRRPEPQPPWKGTSARHAELSVAGRQLLAKALESSRGLPGSPGLGGNWLKGATWSHPPGRSPRPDFGTQWSTDRVPGEAMALLLSSADWTRHGAADAEAAGAVLSGGFSEVNAWLDDVEDWLRRGAADRVTSGPADGAAVDVAVELVVRRALARGRGQYAERLFLGAVGWGARTLPLRVRGQTPLAEGGHFRAFLAWACRQPEISEDALQKAQDMLLRGRISLEERRALDKGRVLAAAQRLDAALATGETRYPSAMHDRLPEVERVQNELMVPVMQRRAERMVMCALEGDVDGVRRWRGDLYRAAVWGHAYLADLLETFPIVGDDPSISSPRPREFVAQLHRLCPECTPDQRNETIDLCIFILGCERLRRAEGRAPDSVGELSPAYVDPAWAEESVGACQFVATEGDDITAYACWVRLLARNDGTIPGATDAEKRKFLADWIATDVRWNFEFLVVPPDPDVDQLWEPLLAVPEGPR